MSRQLGHDEIRALWDEIHQGIFPLVYDRFQQGSDPDDIVNSILTDGVPDDPELGNAMATLAVALYAAALYSHSRGPR